MSPQFSIGYTDERLLEQAAKLSARLHCSIDNKAPIQLLLTPEKLMLRYAEFQPIFIDFSKQHWQHRRNQGKSQDIIKACKPTAGLHIVDATAGWGRDAAILASFGARVTMIERNAVMACLLEDALSRQDSPSRQMLNLTLIQANAITYLEELTDYPEVIYLDPMHPERQKSALVKKDLQILQSLIGYESDSLALLEIAQKRVTKKVVIKWPSSKTPLTTPHLSIRGKTIRYDIFLPK